MSRVRFVLAVAVALGAAAPAWGQQPDPKKPLLDLLAKLKEKREREVNQVYKLEFNRTWFNQGALTRTCDESWELQIDWRTGSYRYSGRNGCRVPSAFEIIEVYDGEKLKTQFRDVTADGKSAGDGSWKFGMITGRLNSATFQCDHWPMFLNKGVIAGHDDRFYPGHFVFDPDPAKFFLGGEVMRDGRKCISLKTYPENPTTPIQYEYLIDPGKDHAVVEFRYFMKGKVSESLDIKVMAVKQPGRWAPSEWTYTLWNPDGSRTHVVKVKVLHFAEDVPVGAGNVYDIVPPEGAKVGRSHYERPEGKDQEITFYEYEMRDGKLVKISGPPEGFEWLRRNWPWLALAGAGLAVTALAIRRARQNPTKEPAPPAGM